jgi:hypothetical protein
MAVLHLTRSIETPIRKDLSTVAEIWNGPDKGLIFCWEQGRREREKKPHLASRAEKGELVPLGRSEDARPNEEPEPDNDELPVVSAEPRRKKEPENHGVWKRGSLQYLAWWQGLRGENLKVSFVEKIEIVCSRVFVAEKGKKKGGRRPDGNTFFRDAKSPLPSRMCR